MSAGALVKTPLESEPIQPRIPPQPEPAAPRHIAFRIVWYAINIVLCVAVLAALWSGAWEYSTRRYLKGFSDAIIPFSSSPVQKIQAILDWMSRSPTRLGDAPESLDDDRDPTETLNYASLLRVCGTATNAFINLADTAGLTTRRLLLLDAGRETVHVAAEVLVGGRWIVVDPAFRVILRGPDGAPLTRDQLIDPAIFHSATGSIPGYEPSYVFDRAVHVRLARLGAAGRALRAILDKWIPDWEGSPALSLIVERESLGFTIVFAIALMFLLPARAVLRWYGESRLALRCGRVRNRLRRLGQLFVEPID